MTHPRTSRVGRLTVAICVSSLVAQDLGSARSEERGFDPVVAFGDGATLSLSVDFAAGLRSVRESPLGSLVLDPAILEALGELPALLERQARELVGELGDEVEVDVLDVLSRTAGRFHVAAFAPDGEREPSAHLAIHLRGERRGLELARELVRVATLALLGEPATVTPVRVGEREGLSFTTRASPLPLQAIEVGDALVISVGGGLEEIARRHDEGGPSAVEPAGTARSIVRLEADFATLRRLVDSPAGSGDPTAQEPPEDPLVAGLRALGLLDVDRVEYECRFDSGDFEHRLRVDRPHGRTGLLADLDLLFGPPADLAGLRLVPSTGLGVAVFSTRPGAFLASVLDRCAGLPLPPALSRGLASARAGIEDVAGAPIRGGLDELPRVTVTSFSMPGGGALHDRFWLAKVGEGQPWLVALDRFTRRVGGRVRARDLDGRTVVCVDGPPVLRALGLGPSTGPLAALDEDTKVLLLAVDPPLELAITVLDESWLLVGSSVQAVERYLARRGSESALGATPERWTSLLPGEGERPRSFAVLDGGEQALGAYDCVVTALAWIAPSLASARKDFGVDLARLPPGEVFRSRFRPGWVVVESSDTEWMAHVRGASTHLAPALLRELATVLLRAGIISESL